MTGLVRRATLISAVGLLVASAAMAGVPSATTSTMSQGLVDPGTFHNATIKLVGHGSPPDDLGALTYTIRDAAGALVAGTQVILNFSACTDAKFSLVDVGPGLTVDCGAKTVSGTTSPAGKITFLISGTGNSAGAAQPNKCVTVTAGTSTFPPLNAATADYNGTTGVDGLDLSQCLGDVQSSCPGCNPTRKRSDFDGNDIADGLDLSIVLAIVNGPGSDNSASSLCP
jgi:hypothetical protein